VYILIPLLKPTLTLVFVISATAAIKLFTELYILIPGAPTSNKTLVAYLYNQAFEQFDLGYGSAIAVVLFVLTLGFSIVQVRLIERHD
jgi:ABC-type sugar transport system permease subunit